MSPVSVGIPASPTLVLLLVGDSLIIPTGETVYISASAAAVGSRYKQICIMINFQAIADYNFVVALQQQRVSAGKPNITVYGISASTNMFRFFRLDPQQKLYQSRVYLLPEDEGWVLLFIDNMITTAATASPNTTSRKFGFYKQPAGFEKHVERPLFSFPQSEVE